MANIPSTLERFWPSVILAPISIANFVVTVSSTTGLHTKQIVSLSTPSQDPQEFEIKRVESDTTIWLGPVGQSMTSRSNPIQFNGGMLTMSEQKRNPMGWDIVGRAVYEEEPSVALRTLNVDKMGQYVDTVKDIAGINRLAVDAALSLTGITVSIANALSLQVVNTPIIAANVEQVLILPANVARFAVRVRDSESVIKLAFSPGTSGTQYFTNHRGNIFESGELGMVAPYSVYYQTPKVGVILEWIIWVK